MNRITWVIAIALLALLIRLPGLGRVMTVDEENWMLRSAEFYDKVLNTDAGGTFLTTHPGSIPMWLIGGGETLQEWRLGIQVDEGTLRHFRKAAVAPMVIAASILIGLITYLLGRLFSWPTALAGGVLLAGEPYLVGMTTIAHLDAVQGLLMLSSLLSFFIAVKNKSFDIRWGIIAGVLCGLAFGFKLILALWLIPVFAMFRPGVRAVSFVTGVAVLVLWLGWPALWVKADLGHSLTRDYATTVTDEHVALEAGDDPIAPVTFYMRTMLGRVTPHVQLLVVGGVLLLASSLALRRKLAAEHTIIGWLLVYSLGFLVFITLAAKKADRYAMPALEAWPVIAGWTWMQATRRWPTFIHAIFALAILGLPFLWLPHALAYNNPFFPNIRPLSQQGWGEGLEEAAAWLNQRPRADQMYIASWYPSVMQTYFVGKTLSLSSKDDYRVQYVVTYRNMGGRAKDTQASDVLDEFRSKKPAYIVSIHSVPYAWIYETFTVGNFTKHVGELVGSKTVGQTVRPEKDGWSKIDLGFATFSSRHNTEDIIVHVRDSATATEDLRTTRVNANAIVDNEWQTFSWTPIPDSAGKEFFVAIDSPASVPGNAVTVRYTDADVRPGQFYLNGKPKTGDIAYRIPE